MKKVKLGLFRGLAAVLGVLCALTSGGTAMAFANPSLVNDFLGTKTSMVVNSDGTVSAQYFECDYSTAAELIEAKKALIAQIGEEGCVLLLNKNNALPLTSSETNISLFGRGSVDLVYDIASGASLNRGDFGAPSSKEPDNFYCLTFEEALANNGKNVNPVMVEFYKNRPERRSSGIRVNPAIFQIVVGDVIMS